MHARAYTLARMWARPWISSHRAAPPAKALGTSARRRITMVSRCALQGLMGRPAAQLAEPGAKHLALGLALLFLGKQDAVEATLEVQKLPRIS